MKEKRKKEPRIKCLIEIDTLYFILDTENVQIYMFISTVRIHNSIWTNIKKSLPYPYCTPEHSKGPVRVLKFFNFPSGNVQNAKS